MDTPQKICSECGLSKLLDEFHNQSSAKDGKNTKCRACISLLNAQRYQLKRDDRLAYQAQYRKDNPEKVSLAVKRWWAENRESALQKHAAWVQEHHEEVKAQKRAHYHKNKDKLKELEKTPKRRQQRRETARRQREKHPDKIRQRKALYSKTHPEQKNAARERRRARKAAAAIVDLTTAQFEEIKAAFQYRCAYCPKDCKACRNKTHQLQQEHIDPIINGGNHTVHNVVPACGSCNSKKQTGPPLIPVQPLLLTIAPAKPLKKK